MRDWPREVHQQYLATLDERDRLIKQLEGLDDAVRDALDLLTGWCRPMSRRQRMRIAIDLLNDGLRSHGSQLIPRHGEKEKL